MRETREFTAEIVPNSPLRATKDPGQQSDYFAAVVR